MGADTFFRGGEATVKIGCFPFSKETKELALLGNRTLFGRNLVHRECKHKVIKVVSLLEK